LRARASASTASNASRLPCTSLKIAKRIDPCSVVKKSQPYNEIAPTLKRFNAPIFLTLQTA